MSLKIFLASAAMVTGLIAAQSPANAEAGGCLKYGAVGAVGGHLAGHGVVGALAGCGAGMWTRHEARKHAADEQAATAELNKQNRAPDYQTYGQNGQGNGRNSQNGQDAPSPFYRQ